METMIITMTGNAGTTGVLCRDSVSPRTARRHRIGSDTTGLSFGATYAISATSVAFPLARAVS